MADIHIIHGITYLYLIHSTSGYSKIGISKNPIKRLRQLSRGTLAPFKNHLVAAIPFSDGHAPKMERQIHHRFANKRARGEWFRLDYRDINWFIEYKERIGDFWLEKLEPPMPFTAENGDCSFMENGDLR